MLYQSAADRRPAARIPGGRGGGERGGGTCGHQHLLQCGSYDVTNLTVNSLRYTKNSEEEEKEEEEDEEGEKNFI